METTPEARSTSDHPSRVEFIVKMAPQSPCSDNHEDKRIPSCRQKKLGHNWADATCTPWSRPPRAPSPRPSSSTPTPTAPRSSTTTWSSSTSWTLSPTESRSPRLAPECRLIPALYKASSNKNETSFGSRRNCKFKRRKNLSVPTKALQGRTLPEEPRTRRLPRKVDCD